MRVEEFERVEAARGPALLRLRASTEDSDPSATRGSLLIEDGTRLERLGPLPAPPDPIGIVRLAFSAPTEILGDRARYTLELPDGSRLELPPPHHRRASAASVQGDGEARPLDPEQARLSMLESRARELERELAEARASAASLAAAAEEAETRALTLEEVVRAEAERREHQAESARIAEESARVEADRARAELAQTRAALEQALAALERGSGPSEPATDVDPDGDAVLGSPGLQGRQRRQREMADRRAADRDAVRLARARRGVGGTQNVRTRTRQTPVPDPPGALGAEPAASHVRIPSSLSERHHRREGQRLLSEAGLGLLLIVLGTILAVLLLAGVIRF